MGMPSHPAEGRKYEIGAGRGIRTPGAAALPRPLHFGRFHRICLHIGSAHRPTLPEEGGLRRAENSNASRFCQPLGSATARAGRHADFVMGEIFSQARGHGVSRERAQNFSRRGWVCEPSGLPAHAAACLSAPAGTRRRADVASRRKGLTKTSCFCAVFRPVPGPSCGRDRTCTGSGDSSGPQTVPSHRERA